MLTVFLNLQQLDHEAATWHLGERISQAVAYGQARQAEIGWALHAAGSVPAELQTRAAELRIGCLLLHLQDEVA
jgi:hypothetical protein